MAPSEEAQQSQPAEHGVVGTLNDADKKWLKSNCGLDAQAARVDRLLAAAKPVVNRFYSGAEGEKEWATFQDEIVHLGDVLDEAEKP